MYPIKHNQQRLAWVQMMGLWYLLGISVIVALVIVAGLHLSKATGTSARIHDKIKGISTRTSERCALPCTCIHLQL